jgi:hypothetical protein
MDTKTKRKTNQQTNFAKLDRQQKKSRTDIGTNIQAYKKTNRQTDERCQGRQTSETNHENSKRENQKETNRQTDKRCQVRQTAEKKTNRQRDKQKNRRTLPC